MLRFISKNFLTGLITLFWSSGEVQSVPILIKETTDSESQLWLF